MSKSKMSLAMTVARFFKIKTIFKINSRCLCSNSSTFSEHDRSFNRNYLFGGILVASGVVGYFSAKQKLNAAAPISLAGRRNQFNFICM